jgi:hypothetical protein
MRRWRLDQSENYLRRDLFSHLFSEIFSCSEDAVMRKLWLLQGPGGSADADSGEVNNSNIKTGWLQNYFFKKSDGQLSRTAASDGISRQVIGINNGKWSCPVIEGTLGDTVIINITNCLGTQSTGVYFHGINQNGSQIMGWPSKVTQCPVPLRSSFTYVFKVRNFNEVLRNLLKPP